MPTTVDYYQQRLLKIASTTLKRLGPIKALLNALVACQTLSSHEKIELLTTAIPQTGYPHVGYALLYTQRAPLIHCYLECLTALVIDHKTALQVCTRLSQRHNAIGTFGHSLASYCSKNCVKHYHQLLRHLLQQKLPSLVMLHLLHVQSPLGLTFSHCIAYQQQSDVLADYFHLLKSLLDANLAASALLALLSLATIDGYPLDHYIALYQSAKGLRHYWLFLDRLIEAGASQTSILHLLQRDIYRGQSLCQCLAYYQRLRGIEHFIHFLDRCLRRDFDATSIAALLTLSTADGQTLGQIFLAYGTNRQLKHYAQLLMCLQQMAAPIPLVQLLQQAFRQDCHPVDLAIQQAQRQNMTPLLTLLELEYPPHHLLNLCLPFKQILTIYIHYLVNNHAKLTIIHHCLNNDGRFALGLLFHSALNPLDIIKNHQYLQSLTYQKLALEQWFSLPPVTSNNTGLPFLWAPKPISARNAIAIQKLLRTFQETPVEIHALPSYAGDGLMTQRPLH